MNIFLKVGSLVSGLYTYTLFNGEKSISKNIIIHSIRDIN